ncbi:MAG: D-glycero-beta-D-manno-heptose-7-phosphate kinase [Elusimicrobia bacterium]|nr:D-glycero-beta-D-manno-heptose-7-phosphate kinase [Elusimicrobiota bacterium]
MINTRTMSSTLAERKELLRTIARFAGRRVLVVGDLMLDQYVRGAVGRISPEAPVPVVRVTGESTIPGGAGNVVNNLASLGAKVSVLGVVGEDEAGARLVEHFRGRGVNVEGVCVDVERQTTQKCRVIAERQQVVRFDRETSGPLSHSTESRLLASLDVELPRADAVILSDYGKGVINPRVLARAIAAARRRGIPITVDPKPEHFRLYKGVTCVTPNTAEAWACMRRDAKPGSDAIDALGKDILKVLKSRSVLITRGPDGMSLFEDGGRTRITHIPTRAREVFDVSGAGDTVISTLTLALAAGAPLRRAAALANHAAGIVVAKLGTATTDAEELSRAIE